MTHRGPFQPLLFCDSVIHLSAAVLTLPLWITTGCTPYTCIRLFSMSHTRRKQHQNPAEHRRVGTNRHPRSPASPHRCSSLTALLGPHTHANTRQVFHKRFGNKTGPDKRILIGKRKKQTGTVSPLTDRSPKSLPSPKP